MQHRKTVFRFHFQSKISHSRRLVEDLIPEPVVLVVVLVMVVDLK